MPELASGLENVSRETAEALQHYVDLLLRWNQSINLIGRGTAVEVWARHIADSAQLATATKPPKHWCDLGSGGGLPAVVVAILARDRGWTSTFTCVESDQRKCAFLRTAARELDLPLEVVVGRAEAVGPVAADLLSARAVAPLERLVELGERHRVAGGKFLFPKGRMWREELEAARRSWHFSLDVVPSVTDREAVILVLGEISRV